MIHEISKTHSRLATIIVAFDAGARVEAESGYNPGIAHMLEHSLFKGSAKRNSLQIQREIAFLGGSSNAFTSHESVAYYISVPFENIEPCMDILSDMVFDPIFPEEEIVREIEVVKEEEISSLDDASSYMWREFSANFFSNYLASPVIGTQDSISQFSADEVSRFHKEFCGRKNAVVSLCSNLSKKDSKALLNKYFGQATGKIGRGRAFDSVDYLGYREMAVTKAGIEHSYVWMGMPSEASNSPIAGDIQVLMTILGRGMDSRLFTEVREKRGLVYGVSSSHTDWETGGLTLIEFSTRQANLEEAKSVALDQIDLIKRYTPTEEEVQRAKNKMRSSFYSAIDDSYSIAYWAIKRRLRGLPSIAEYMEMIESATPESVSEAARRILDTDRQLLFLCSGQDG